jgi:NADPH-dependent F420 reductase
VRVAIVGGTGAFGLALAARLVEAGDEVVIGSRDAERAQQKASEVGATSGRANEEAVGDADLVVLATNADGALSTATALADALGDVPLLSVASELHFGPGGARPGSDQRSLAERTGELVRSPVVAGLHSLAAGKLARGRPDEDAFVCGDDPDAKVLALELAAKVVAGRALDAGPLASARALEGMTAVIVNLNRRYKGHAGIRVTGLP